PPAPTPSPPPRGTRPATARPSARSSARRRRAARSRTPWRAGRTRSSTPDDRGWYRRRSWRRGNQRAASAAAERSSTPLRIVDFGHPPLVVLPLGVGALARDVVEECLHMVLPVELAAPVGALAGPVQDAVAGSQMRRLETMPRADEEGPGLRRLEPHADRERDLAGRPLRVGVDDRAACIDAQVGE